MATIVLPSFMSLIVYFISAYRSANSKFGIVQRLLSSRYNNTQLLILGGVTVISYYILGPSISGWLSPGSADMFKSSPREDRYTTGLTNSRNDCFANSSIQALASLPALAEYLNGVTEVVRSTRQALGLLVPRDDAADFSDHGGMPSKKSASPFTDPAAVSANCAAANGKEPEGNHVTPDLLLPDLRMHEALSIMIHNLQQPVKNYTQTSLQPLLHTLEQIHNAKISSGQNDAHEFSQILFETLEKERLALKTFLEKQQLSDIRIPEFPFQGSLATNLICLRCNNSSKVNVHRFTMHSLPVPQMSSASLKDMMFDNQTETIEGYSCISCRLRAILNNERQRDYHNVSQEERAKLDDLAKLLPRICINDDLPEPLELYVKSYHKDGCHIPSLKSRILKRTVVVSSPKVLLLHLSRSVFDGVTYTKNSCNVLFPEDLILNEQEIKEDRCIAVHCVRYKLQAMIKHTGTHFQGHYEVFRHKPDFVKDLKSRAVFISSPTVALPVCTSSSTSKNALLSFAASYSTPITEAIDAVTTTSPAAETIPDTTQCNNNNNPPQKPPRSSTLKRIAHLMPSKQQTTPSRTTDSSNSSEQEIHPIPSSEVSSNPAVGQPHRPSSASSNMINTHSATATTSTDDITDCPASITAPALSTPNPTTYRKIKHVSTHPWWHISDTQVAERKTSELVAETKHVYMLYYQQLPP
ncbi:putative ubiquitin-specific protease UBP16 Ecym_1166 [Eremothecium cymbalariae DBVPG|uniref:USP domain-containing protein n=1 Tax=Eremothecium cymbalariae (strain CBS 270.75 / DBVPG 7215 / KCTC 17166 / NRRL Y-17582) TaxID=931890 RepID=G8JMV2_ERECY|nr:hypothetical protein Ecym_1166 [Eremothecium cymbalariae DBVPG\